MLVERIKKNFCHVYGGSKINQLQMFIIKPYIIPKKKPKTACEEIYTERYQKELAQEMFFGFTWQRESSGIENFFPDFPRRDTMFMFSEKTDGWFTRNEERIQNDFWLYCLPLSIKVADGVFVKAGGVLSGRYWFSQGETNDTNWDALNTGLFAGPAINISFEKWLLSATIDISFGRNKNTQEVDNQPGEMCQEDTLMILHIHVQKHFCNLDNTKIFYPYSVYGGLIYTDNISESKINFDGEPFDPFEFSVYTGASLFQLYKSEKLRILFGPEIVCEYKSGFNKGYFLSPRGKGRVIIRDAMEFWITGGWQGVIHQGDNRPKEKNRTLISVGFDIYDFPRLIGIKKRK